MKKGLSNEIKERIERIEGVDFFDAVKSLYIDQLFTYRRLCKRWNCNPRTVAKVLSECRISPREGGEAIKAQWVNADERRIKAGKKLADTNHNLAILGKHVRQGKNKKNSDLIRGISEKLKTSSSFLKDDIRKRAAEASKQTRMLHPERMSALRFPPSKNEKILFDFLLQKGVCFEFRKLIGRHIVDFFIPSKNLVIECMASGRFPLDFDRHSSISNEGVRVVYCVNNFIQKADFSDLYDHIASLDSRGIHPSITGEKTVVWGARRYSPFGSDRNDISVIRIRMNTYYKLLIS